MAQTTRRGRPKPRRYGRTYKDGEVVIIYLVQKSRKAQRKLERLLGRTEDTVDLIWGWCDGRGYPPKAANKIKRQVGRIKRVLGADARGASVL